MLTLWDDPGADPPDNGTLVYCWNGYAQRGAAHSILQFIEEHAELLRSRYLAWIHELGESVIEGKRVIDHLAFADGFSYWWMTLFVEKSPYKSRIVDAIRLLALEEILRRDRPGRLRLVSADRKLKASVRMLCQELDIGYICELPTVPARRLFSLMRVYHRFPASLRGFLSLVRQTVKRWPLRRAPVAGWFQGDRSLFFCSYFDNIDSKAAAVGHFHSFYFGDLPSQWHRQGGRSNWLQIFVPCSVVPRPEVAVSWARRFNQSSEEEGRHTFVDAFLTWRIVCKVFARWLWLHRVACRLRANRGRQPPGGHSALWSLMQNDWQESFCGPTAISNLLWIALFDEALRTLPHQNKGIYVCENQGWERALIHAWRKYGHGTLIAAGHVPVRFWDLRHFSDPRTAASSAPYPIPQPDITTLNGRPAMEAYLGAYHPKDRIVACEALRYGYLHDLQADRRSAPDRPGPRRVLILGDIGAASTAKLLHLLDAVVAMHPSTFSCVAKPHPNCPIRTEDYRSLHLEVVTDPLNSILCNYDVAYASGATSAAVDAYLAGLPVVVMLDETELNLSPLRGQPGVRFVSTPDELATALQDVQQDPGDRPNTADFFFLDPALPRWFRLLAS